MSDVARRAGVSRTTVSFVLNDVDRSGIPEATKKKVRQIAANIGYRPNAAARLLRVNRSHAIGFVTDEIASTPFAGNVIKGAQDAAWAADRILMIVNTGSNAEVAATAVETMLQRRVEGIIHAAWYHQPVTPPPGSREVPTVLLDCYAEDRSLSAVVPDEAAGGYAATEALLRAGHRRIGFVNLHEGIPASAGRLEGYRRALEEHEIAYDGSLVRFGEGDARGGYEQTLELLRRSERPTGLFCGTDRMAMGAYDAIKESGLRIPEDIAVVGFDNQEIIAAYLRPPLSTVALPHYEMGQWAVKHLIRQSEDGDADPVHHAIRCPYVERESV